MPEVNQPLLPVETNYVCDSCGTGFMQRSSTLEVVSDEGFMHVCNFCGTSQQLDEIYPKTTYVNFYGFLNDASKAIADAKAKTDDVK